MLKRGVITASLILGAAIALQRLGSCSKSNDSDSGNATSNGKLVRVTIGGADYTSATTAQAV